MRRNVEHLRDYATREPTGKPRAIRLRFFSSPVAILGDERVEAIELVRNELWTGRAVADGRARDDPVRRRLPQRRLPRRRRSPGVPFDERAGTIPNEGGRVEPGLYCAGWIKRGPSGVIGTNKKDATETVALLLEDARAGLPAASAATGTLESCSRSAASSRSLRGLGGDRRRRARGAASRTAARGSSCATWDELLAAAGPRKRSSNRLLRGIAASLVRGTRERVAGADNRTWMPSSRSSAFAAALPRELHPGDIASGSSAECPRCHYVGWASSNELTERTRKLLRDLPLERRPRSVRL